MSIISSSVEAFRDHPEPTVYLRQKWADEWTKVDFLRCDELVFAVNPTLPRAVFYWRYGDGKQAELNQYAAYQPLDRLDWYVKVEVPQTFAEGETPPAPIQWYGIIEDVTNQRDGALLREADGGGVERVLTGRQHLVAVGFEELLTRQRFDRATIADFFGNEAEIGRPIRPNAPSDFQPTGNRSPFVGDRGAYVFTDSALDGVKWSTRDFVGYLLAYHVPADPGGTIKVPWGINDFQLDQLPDWDEIEPAVEGASIKDLLDRLMDRRRLLGYHVTVDEDANKVLLSPFTFAEDPITVPTPDGGTATLEANPFPKTLDFDRGLDIRRATVRDSSASKFDQVVVRGARRRSVFSISRLDNTLEQGWLPDEQQKYDEGATNEDDYSTLEVFEKQRRNQEWRSAEDLRRVYSYFDFPQLTFEGEAGDGEGAGGNPIFPKDDNPLEGREFYRSEFVFLPRLPLLQDHDYVADPTGARTGPEEAGHDFMPTLAFLKVEQDEAGADRYQQIELLGTGEGIETLGEGAGRHWSASVQTQARAAGVIVKVHGAPQHILALTDFTPAESSDEAATHDWRDNLICTVAAEWDFVLEVKHPTDDAIGAEGFPDLVRRLTIDVGERYRLDYLVPETVVGIRDGQLRRSTGGFIRDDRERAEALARQAWQWYQKARKAFDLSYRQVQRILDVGDLVVEIGADQTKESVRSVVTSVKYDLVEGLTTIGTDFAELDVLGL